MVFEPLFIVVPCGIDGVNYVEWDGKRELADNEKPVGEVYPIHPGSVDSVVRMGLGERLSADELKAYQDQQAAAAQSAADAETKKGKK